MLPHIPLRLISTVFSRVPETEQYHSNLRLSKRYYKMIIQYYNLHLSTQVSSWSSHFKFYSWLTGTVLAATKLFLKNVVLGVEVRWTIRDTKHCGKVSNQYLWNRQFEWFYFTFGFVRGGKGDARVVVNMDYVASDELGNLVRHGFVIDVQFTYVVR